MEWIRKKSLHVGDSHMGSGPLRSHPTLPSSHPLTCETEKKSDCRRSSQHWSFLGWRGPSLPGFHPLDASYPPEMYGQGSGNRQSPEWGVSAGQVSRGWEWCLPMWKQPRDRHMPLPTSHTMNLNIIHCYQSTINPSALFSGLPFV
jgi:hypothetical protein